MKLSNIFNQSLVKEFASDLAKRLLKDIPPRMLEKHQAVLSVNKITRLLERMSELAVGFQSQHQLGFVNRAILANHFKWTLKEAGYPDDFVDLATESLVVALSKKK